MHIMQEMMHHKIALHGSIQDTKMKIIPVAFLSNMYNMVWKHTIYKNEKNIPVSFLSNMYGFFHWWYNSITHITVM